MSSLQVEGNWRDLGGLQETLRDTFPVLVPMTSSAGSQSRKANRAAGSSTQLFLISATGEGRAWVWEVGNKLPLWIRQFPFWTGGNWLTGTLKWRRTSVFFTLWYIGSFQVTHLGKQLSCLLSPSCCGTNIHLMRKHSFMTEPTKSSLQRSR